MLSRNRTPEFCFIAPTAYLDFTRASHSHLVLAHLVDNDDTYARFYKACSTSGDFVIMDNSAYELKEPYSPEKLIDLGKMCGADAIVLPDYPFQPAQKTIEAAEEFNPLFKEAGVQSFFVPQSKRGDWDDWVDAYKWAANNDDIHIIGMSILGIPNAVPHISPSYARVVMTQTLISHGVFNFEKHHHYLGLNAGPALEIPSLINMNALDTIDSSGPIQAALMGHEYSLETDSLQSVKKLKMPVDFNLPRTKDQDTLRRIEHNISLTLALFDKSKETNEVWYAQ